MKRFFSVLLMGCFLTAPAFGAAAKRVGFVLWDGCDEACRGFQDALKASDSAVTLTLYDLKKDLNKIPAVLTEIKQNKPDLLATWGTLPTLKLVGSDKNALSADYITSIPTVFMVVSQPVESGLVSALSSQGRNITGVVSLVPVSEQLQAARQFRLFDRIGVVYNAGEANSASVVAQVKKYASMMNFDVIERKIPLTSDGRPDASKIEKAVAEIAEQKAGLIYLPPDAFMNTHRDVLTQAAADAGIPVFSASEGAVIHGEALFAFVHRYYTIGLFAGQKAVKILQNGIPAYDIPIEAPRRGLFVVNMTVARKLGIYPPLGFVQGADFVNIPANQ